MKKYLATILVLLAFIACEKKDRPAVTARAGVLDLREDAAGNRPAWDFDRHGTLELNGEWEIYWNKLLDPTDFLKPGENKPSAYVRVPARWNSLTFDGAPAGSTGYATYRLKLILPGNSYIQNELLALRCRYEQSAYRIFWNGIAVAANGVVAKEKESYRPEYRPLIARVPGGAKHEIEIIVQVANFAHRSGGFTIPIELGLAPALTAYTRTRQLTEAFLLGAVLLMSCYFFGLFFSRPVDRAPLWFALCCLATFARILLTGDRLVMQLPINPDWAILLRSEYLSFNLANAAALLYLHQLFENESNKKIRNILLIAIACIAAPALALPPAIFTHTLLPAQITIVLTLVFAYYVSVKAMLHRREGAQAIFLGFVLLSFTVINDILYNQFLIGPGYITPYGVFCLVLTHSVALSRRLAAGFKQTENLKENLEVQVELRTVELKEAIAVAQQATAAKSAFFAMMTHELRTPLNGIIGMSNILKLTPLNTEQEKYLGIIHTSGSNLMSVINDILDFSVIDAGKFSLNKTAFPLPECLDEVMALGKTLLKDKNVKLTMAPLPSDFPVKIFSDQARIRQALLNLVSNAVKFTEKGYIHLNCSVLEKSATKVTVEFSVEDTGIGISEEDQQNLFKPYTQADQTISRRYGGTGLGLVISSRIIEALGGNIFVSSLPDKGSCFFFTLQFDIPGADEITATTALNPPVEIGNEFANRYPLRLLVAEDDVVNQVVITESLRVLGYKATMAENGQEAIEYIERERFDLILMDMQMPEVSGIEATERIRKMPNGKSLIIIALTADSSMENQRRCFDAGMDDFLMKPFNLASLQNALMKWSQRPRQD